MLYKESTIYVNEYDVKIGYSLKWIMVNHKKKNYGNKTLKKNIIMWFIVYRKYTRSRKYYW